MNTPNTNIARPSQDVTAANPFQSERHQHINQGAVAIEESRAIAEAQGKLIVAKRFPRDQAAAYERIMKSCARKGLAEAAMYSFPRGGQVITGPSIRLAEELARAWGNIDYGIRELSQKEGGSEMEAYCWDLETNTFSSQKFTVKHELHTKNGVKRLTDPRDIYEITANNGGRRLRARILAILPPDIVDAAVEQCYATLAGANTEPIEDRVKKMLKAFSPFGVMKEHIEQRLGKKLDSVLSEDIVQLTTIYQSLRDNMSKPSDWFGSPDAAEAPAPIAELNTQVSEQTAKPKATRSRRPTPEIQEAELVQTGESPKMVEQPKADEQANPQPSEEYLM
jgi:hypothetical protein